MFVHEVETAAQHDSEMQESMQTFTHLLDVWSHANIMENSDDSQGSTCAKLGPVIMCFKQYIEMNLKLKKSIHRHDKQHLDEKMQSLDSMQQMYDAQAENEPVPKQMKSNWSQLCRESSREWSTEAIDKVEKEMQDALKELMISRQTNDETRGT
eukprot:263027_1